MNILSNKNKLYHYTRGMASIFYSSLRNYGWAILLSCPLYATADAIDRSQARLVANHIVTIDDNTSDSVPLAPYYIFSRGAGKGYVIVSGDDSTAPIIGYTDSGDYVEGKLPQPLQALLDSWTEKIKKLQQKNPNKAKAISAAKIGKRFAIASYKSSWTDVPVLMTTHWHQSYPYNMLAPHRTDNNNQALTGCLATAASQIVYYFRKDNPSATLYDTPTYGYGGAPVTKSLPKGTPLRYDLMKTSGTGSLKQDSAVAVLMYAAGTSAWLTYGDGDGTATSGQNNKMGEAIRGQFALNNECKYKESYSQQGWEKLVYENLTSGRPLLYTGASDSQGGHAVVLDGYQASTGLYHFNFGWGGQGDGYYTIDDETGMNGFHSYQSALVNITPKTQNYSARLLTPTLYEKTTSTIQAVVTNKATLAQSNFSIYCSTSNTKPSTITAQDQTTIVASGDSAVISFQYKPINNKAVNIWLYDSQDQLLDKITVDVMPAKSNLRLNHLSADISGTTTVVDGISFNNLYNTEANINVSLTNQEGGTICQPILKCSMFEYDKDAHAWSADSTSKIINSLQFNIGETCDTIFQFKYLQEGKLYKAHLVPIATTTTKDKITIDTPDSVVYFMVCKPTLAIEKQGRQAVATGGWNPTVFASLATDPHVTSYDLTAVDGIVSQPKAANSNALFYATKAIDGCTNIVVEDECQNLKIEEGSEFLAQGKLHAAKVQFVPKNLERGKVKVLALPFDCEVPEYCQIRNITSVSNIKLNNEQAKKIVAKMPFTLIASHPDFGGFVTNDVDIATDSVYTAFHDSISVSTLATTTSGKAMVFGEKNSLPYYLNTDEGTEVEPFAMVIHNNYNSGTRVYQSNEERAYASFADSLYSAYMVLKTYPGLSISQQFADSIAKYEQAFCSYAYDGFMDINNDAKRIGELIEKFLNDDLPTGINPIAVKDTVEDNTTDSAPRYYSIDGTPLQSLRRGIVIVRQGGKTKKIIVR